MSFDSYLPDSSQPSQTAAVAALRAFATRIEQPEAPKRSLFRRAAPPESRAGVYLDGGFGVGKTHLLASLWHAVPGPKRFGTFVEYTNLVGALGFRTAVGVLRIDGDDYRHRGLPEAPPPMSPEELAAAVASHPGAALDRFDALLAHLSRVHPSRYGALVEGVPLLALEGVRTVTDQA